MPTPNDALPVHPAPDPGAPPGGPEESHDTQQRPGDLASRADSAHQHLDATAIRVAGMIRQFRVVQALSQVTARTHR